MKLHRLTDKAVPTRRADVLLVVGPGHTLPHDIRDWERLVGRSSYDVMTVNLGYKFPGLNPALYWCALDHEDPIVQQWAVEQAPYTHRVTGFEAEAGFDAWLEQEPVNHWPGSSSMLGVMTGIHFGYDRIVLAGIPMDNRGYWDNPAPINFAHRHLRFWIEFARTNLSKRVRSLSGHTSFLLNKPDSAWIENGEPDAENPGKNPL